MLPLAKWSLAIPLAQLKVLAIAMSKMAIDTTIKQELLPITTLRFISALWVFLFHVRMRWPIDLPAPIANIISQGPLGMSIFFILSGFVLTYTYFNKEPSQNYKSYTIKRFARIYPVYLVISILTLPFLQIAPIPIDAIGWIHYLFTYSIVIALNILLLQAWFPSLFNYWIDGGTWSLSVECFFYLLFPYILAVLKKLSIERLKLLLSILYVLAVLPGLVFVTPLVPKVTFATVYALPIYRLPEFTIGIVLAILFIKDCQKERDAFFPATYKLIACVICLLVYLSIFANAFPQIYVIHNFMAIPLLAAIVYYCASLNKGYLYRMLSHRYLVFLGKISYSFYLVQSIPILFFEHNYRDLVKMMPWLSDRYLLNLIIFCLTLLGSWVAYRQLEDPLRRTIVRRIG
jgi:peptidoglycan/LPS O-acetylase OafA/YrhL